MDISTAITDLSAYAALAVALACGVVIGLDRERSGDEEFGGIRTYPLIALVGAIAQLVAATAGEWIMGLAFLGIFAWVAIYYFSRAAQGHFGMTSEFAGVVTFLCGVLAMQGRLGMAFAIAILVTTILALKSILHRNVRELSPEDINSILKFLVVAFVALPLLPNETYTLRIPGELLPTWLYAGGELAFEVINPRKVGWMVVLIASISFTGFVSSKLIGAHKGLGLTAFLGGLASSTAVTLSFASRARTTPQLMNLCVVAILVASTTMFFRVLVEVAVVAPGLLGSVIKPIGAMAITGIIVCIFFWLQRGGTTSESQDVKLTNPFELTEAIKFGAFFAIVLLVADLSRKLFGNAGLYLSGLFAGLTDVDAITLSAAQLTLNDLEPISHRTATITITIAALANTVIKGALAYFAGGRKLGLRVIAGFLVVALVGITVLWAV